MHLNDIVKVELSERGLAILKEEHYNSQRVIHKDDIKSYTPFKLRIVDNKYVEFMLWELMSLFGPYMTFGELSPFVGELIIKWKKRRLQNGK